MEDRPLNDFSWTQYLNEGRLMGSRCGECGQVFVPPRDLCINCYQSKMEWFQTSGKGKLSAFTCISVGPPSMVSEGYDRNNPYCVGVVELEEGVRVVARINGMNNGKPEAIGIGTPLKVAFLRPNQDDSGETILAFEPL